MWGTATSIAPLRRGNDPRRNPSPAGGNVPRIRLDFPGYESPDRLRPAQTIPGTLGPL